MPVPAIRAIRAKPHLIHVALLDVLIGVLVDAVLLAALAVEAEEAAHRHARLVVLVQEAARVALHAQPAQPVPAHGLPEASAAAAMAMGRRGAAAVRRGSGGVGGRHRGGGPPNDSGGAGAGCVDAALEVEAEPAVAVVHFGVRVLAFWGWEKVTRGRNDLIFC